MSVRDGLEARVERLENTQERLVSVSADHGARLESVERLIRDTSRSLEEINSRLQQMAESQIVASAERAATDRWLRNSVLVVTLISIVYGALTAVNLGLT